MRQIYLIILTLFLSNIINAQEIKVLSLEHLQSDISARTQAQYDSDNNKAALIKVSVPGLENVAFQGSYVLKSEYRSNEYWVYVAQGIKKFTISHKNFMPCTVDLGKFYKEQIESGATYRLFVKVQKDNNMTLAVIRTNVRNATLAINGKSYTTTDGEFDVTLEKGTYNYSITTEKEGFTPATGEFYISGENAIEQIPQINLPSSQKYTLTLSAENDVRYKIDSKELDKTGNVTQSLPAGIYDVEAFVGDGTSWYKREKVDLSSSDVALNMSLSGDLKFISPKEAQFDIKPLDGALNPQKTRFGTNEIIHALGSYSITASKKGYDSKTIIISVVPGENKRKIKLVSKADKLYNGWDNTEKNINKAQKEYEKLAERGDEEAQYMLGRCYYDNNDHNNAMKWWRKAADQGQTDAMIELGKAALSCTEKIKWFTTPATEGYKEAEYRLGMAYLEKEDSESLDKAESWFQKANEHGVENAQRELAAIALKRQNYEQAFTLYTSAVASGESVPQETLIILGDMFFNGTNGVARNYEHALQCYQIVAKNGNEYAKERIADYHYYGYGKTPENKNVAMQMYRELKYPKNDLIYRIAIYLLSEKNDTTEAAIWLQKIDDPNFKYMDGMGECFFKIANYLYNNNDKSRAVSIFEKASAQGCQDRKMNRIIGVEYFKGKEVPQDYTKAFIYLKRGYEENDRVSTRFLALCYERGNGVIVDRAKAKQLYEEAIKLGDISSYSYLGTMYYQEGDEGIDKAMAIWKVGGNNKDKKSIELIIKYLSVKTDARSKEEINQWKKVLSGL